MMLSVIETAVHESVKKQIDEQFDGIFCSGKVILARARWVEAPKATSRHTRRLVELLPSGPDSVTKLVLREHLRGLHCWMGSKEPIKCADYGRYPD